MEKYTSIGNLDFDIVIIIYEDSNEEEILNEALENQIFPLLRIDEKLSKEYIDYFNKEVNSEGKLKIKAIYIAYKHKNKILA